MILIKTHNTIIFSLDSIKLEQKMAIIIPIADIFEKIPIFNFIIKPPINNDTTISINSKDYFLWMTLASHASLRISSDNLS